MTLTAETARLRAAGPTANANATIPEDIISGNILPRLPAKSLLRFRSVCKHWNSLISDNPNFANLHLHFHRQSQCHLLYEAKRASSRLLSLKIDPYQLDEVQNYSGEDANLRPIVLGSSNGLVCFQEPSNGHGYALSNPVTRARRLVRAPPGSRGCRVLCQGFGFSPSCNDYKIVVLYGFECTAYGSSVVPPLVSYAYVFASRANKWSRIHLKYSPDNYANIKKSELPRIADSEARKPAVQVGETLHWGLHCWALSCFDSIVLAFDLANDSVHSVPLPDPLQDESCRQLGMINALFISEIRNRLCLSWRASNTHMLEVWMLQRYGETESWEMFFAVEDVNAYWYRNLLDIKDDSGRVLLLHDDCYKLITPQCGGAAVSTNPYQHRLQLTCALGCIESLISPFTDSKASRRIGGLKRKKDHVVNDD